MVLRKIFFVVRPIGWSVLLLFLTAIIAQTVIGFFMPGFNILASKDLGKIIFTILVFGALGFFVTQQPPEFRATWIRKNILFLKQWAAFKVFVQCFMFFFFLHVLFLAICYGTGYATLQSVKTPNLLKLIGQLLFGFCATFMLALTEEIMFRGSFFPYFSQWLRPITAAFVTSLCFMIVHFLPNPVTQLRNEWPIGIGLFLLGFMLNLIFIKANTMYANIGTHAGLVYVKVILRKIRFFAFAPAATLPWLLHPDLRQAPLVHIIFGFIIIGLVINMHKKVFISPKN
jgi:membrane protease YdiL (CAAX protease family)